MCMEGIKEVLVLVIHVLLSANSQKTQTQNIPVLIPRPKSFLLVHLENVRENVIRNNRALNIVVVTCHIMVVQYMNCVVHGIR